MASKSRSGTTNKKRAAARAKAHDRRLLASAQKQDEEGTGPSADRGGKLGEYAREQLAKACDQLGGAIAIAEQAGEFETVEAMTPVMATLWSMRMELGETVGGAS